MDINSIESGMQIWCVIFPLKYLQSSYVHFLKCSIDSFHLGAISKHKATQ